MKLASQFECAFEDRSGEKLSRSRAAAVGASVATLLILGHLYSPIPDPNIPDREILGRAL
jgi:hypothetical protein